MNNTIKARGNNNLNSLNNKGNPRRGDKRGKRPYNKKNNNRSEKVRVAKPDKYHGKKKKFKL